MKAAITSGLKNSMLFYAASMAMAIAVHVTIGWENRSLFPKSAMVLIFAVLNAGELVPHVISLVIIAVFLKNVF